jgi:hypothetical protein
MKRAILAAVVVVVVAAAAVGVWWAIGNEDETRTTGTCGNTTYELSAESDDDGIEVTFELQSEAPGEMWDVVVEQDGTPVLEGQRQTDEDAELDVDVTVAESDGTSFEVTATPESGEACTASVDH